MALMSGGHGSTGAALSQLVVHSGCAPPAADALLRAMVPRVQKAPSQGRLMSDMAESLVLVPSQRRESRPLVRSHLRLIQWEAIIPSYLAARRAAGQGERGWLENGWCETILIC